MHKGVVNVINATIVQNDVIVRRFINGMNMVMDAQCDVIMQFMVGNKIICMTEKKFVRPKMSRMCLFL